MAVKHNEAIAMLESAARSRGRDSSWDVEGGILVPLRPGLRSIAAYAMRGLNGFPPKTFNEKGTVSRPGNSDEASNERYTSI